MARNVTKDMALDPFRDHGVVGKRIGSIGTPKGWAAGPDIRSEEAAGISYAGNSSGFYYTDRLSKDRDMEAGVPRVSSVNLMGRHPYGSGGTRNL